MKSIGLPSWERIKEVPVGGLITPTKDWIGAIGIVAARHEDLSFVGWLASPVQEMVGQCFHFGDNEKVLSYREWLFEADLSRGLAEVSNVKLAVPYLGKNGMEMKFKQNVQGHVVGYCPTGSKPSDIAELLTIPSWRIWASNEARFRADTPPLIDHFQ